MSLNNTSSVSPNEWPEPNFEDPIRRSHVAVILNFCCFVLATIFVVARVYTRVYLSRWFGADDVFIIVGLGFTASLVALFYIATSRFGYDKHTWDLSPDERAATAKIGFLYNILFILAANSIHVSWICFYFRVVKYSSIQWFTNFLWTTAAIMMTLFVVFLALAIRLCFPVNALWAFPPLPKASCLPRKNITLSGGIIKTCVDFVLVALPVPLILRITMEKSQRITLLSLLSLGILVTIAGGIRNYYIHQMYFVSKDHTWNAFSAHLAGSLENSIGIICACIPPMGRLMGRKFLRFFSVFGTFNGQTSPSTTSAEPKTPTSASTQPAKSDGSNSDGTINSPTNQVFGEREIANILNMPDQT